MLPCLLTIISWQKKRSSKGLKCLIKKRSKWNSDFLKTATLKDKRKIKKIRNCCKKQYFPNNMGKIIFADKRSLWKIRFLFFFKNVWQGSHPLKNIESTDKYVFEDHLNDCNDVSEHPKELNYAYVVPNHE